MDEVKKSKIDLDKFDSFDYGYVILFNLDFIGLFLVSEIAYKTIYIEKIINKKNSYNYLYNRLARNYIILTPK